MRTLLCLSAIASSISLTTNAFADEKALCADAALKGQQLQDAHRLLEARTEFRVCARSECPVVVRGDCATWLNEVERDLPTVVIVARDGKGAPLTDVQVSVDGRPLMSGLDGKAVRMDPGAHAFHFEAAGARLDRPVTVLEGQRDQQIAVVLVAGADASVATQPGQAQRVGGIVLGAAGVAGIAFGAFAGLHAASTYSDFKVACGGTTTCAVGSDGPPLRNSASTWAAISTVAFATGTALATGGLVLFFTAPRESRSLSALQVTPGAGGGTLSFAGRFQ